MFCVIYVFSSSEIFYIINIVYIFFWIDLVIFCDNVKSKGLICFY